MTPALEVRDLSRTFGGEKSLFGRVAPSVYAVRSVSFDVRPGEVLGIVGESGCGKTTLARMLVGLLPPSAGEIRIDGEDLSAIAGDAASFGQRIQYVFQDPQSSLNPRKTVRQIMEAPLIHLLGMDEPRRRQRIDERAGLPDGRAGRVFSARIGIGDTQIRFAQSGRSTAEGGTPDQSGRRRASGAFCRRRLGRVLSQNAGTLGTGAETLQVVPTLFVRGNVEADGFVFLVDSQFDE